MNYEEWATTERLALQAISEFSRMGIPVPTGKGAPSTTVGILTYQTARAFDAAIETDEPVGFGFDDDRDSETDRECRATAHRVLDRLIAARHERKRARRSATDEERQDMQAMLSLLPLRNSFSPSSAPAADAQPGSELEYFQRCAAACTGGVI